MAVCSTGAGSASPVVSSITRRKADAAVVEIAQQAFERDDQIAAQRAAQAAALQQHHVVVDGLDQQMVEADLAELVDDDGGVGERRILQQAVEQRGLAGAEEAGQHGQGNWLGRAPQVARAPASVISSLGVSVGLSCGLAFACGGSVGARTCCGRLRRRHSAWRSVEARGLAGAARRGLGCGAHGLGSRPRVGVRGAARPVGGLLGVADGVGLRSCDWRSSPCRPSASAALAGFVGGPVKTTDRLAQRERPAAAALCLPSGARRPTGTPRRPSWRRHAGDGGRIVLVLGGLALALLAAHLLAQIGRRGVDRLQRLDRPERAASAMTARLEVKPRSSSCAALIGARRRRTARPARPRSAACRRGSRWRPG